MTTNDNINERLKGLQDQLIERGVRDIHFCLDPLAVGMTTTSVSLWICVILEHYLEGLSKPLDITGL